MLSRLVLLATEGGIPVSNPWSKAAVPLGIVIFIGGVYLLLRSNLGTRRGYLVMSTSLWGFTLVLAMFWTFGAPGTPANTGPQNLPGQDLEAYLPVWRPFAGDSNLARGEYDLVQSFPEGFGEVPDGFGQTAGEGAADILTFFSSLSGTEPYQSVIPATAAYREEEIRFADNPAGFDVIGVPIYPTYQLAQLPDDAPDDAMAQLTPNGERVADDESNVAPEGTATGDIVEGAEPQVFYAFFDPGAPSFPSYLMMFLIFVLLALHMVALYRDEGRENRERRATREATAPAPSEPAEPVSA